MFANIVILKDMNKETNEKLLKFSPNLPDTLREMEAGQYVKIERRMFADGSISTIVRRMNGEMRKDGHEGNAFSIETTDNVVTITRNY